MGKVDVSACVLSRKASGCSGSSDRGFINLLLAVQDKFVLRV